MDYFRKLVRKPIQKVSIVNYLSIHKNLKEWLRRKKPKKVFEYLQQHKPELSQHNYLCLEVNLKSIIKLIHSELIKNQLPSIPLLDRYSEEGYRILNQLHQELHCEQSCLKGNSKVKSKLDKHIDRFWIGYLDFCINLSLGYKINNQWNIALGLLDFAHLLCQQILSSATSNRSLLRKIVKVKQLAASIYTEISQYKRSICFLEDALHISLNQLIIRDREKDYQKKQVPNKRKYYKEYEECKQTILRILIKLTFNYDLLQQHDMVPFLVDTLRSLLVEWRIQKTTGIYKIIQKIDSNQTMGWHMDYEAVFIELNYICSLIFDVKEIKTQKIERDKKHRFTRKVKKIRQQDQKKNEQQQQVHAEDQLQNPPERNSVTSSLRESKVVSHPSIGTISQSKGIQASGEMPCSQQLLDFDDMEIVKNKRKTLVYRKQSKKKNQERNSTKKIQKQKQEFEQNDVEGYIRAILETSQPRNRFQTYNKVEGKLRKLSLNIKKSFNEIQCQMYKIRSRSNQARSINRFKERNAFSNIENVNIPSLDCNTKQKSSRVKKLVKAKPEPSGKNCFHELLFKHKQQLDLNRLYAHYMRTADKESTHKFRMKRSGKAMQLNKPVIKQFIHNLYQKSKLGIEMMKQQIKNKVQKQPVILVKPKKIPKKVRDTKLYLSSIHHALE